VEGDLSSVIAPRLPKDAPLWRRALRTVARLAQGMYYHDALSAAPQMAFQFFLSLVPLLVVFGYIVGHLVRLRGVEAIIAPLLGTAPDATQGIVRRELERLGGSSAAPAPLAVLGFVWLASSGTHGFMDALERVTGAKRRPWWKKRAYAIGWVVAGLIGLSATAWAVVQWEEVVADGPEQVTYVDATRARGSETYEKPTAEPKPVRGRDEARATARAAASNKSTRARLVRAGTRQYLTLGVSLVIATAMLALFYRHAVERPKTIKRRVWPGAILAIGSWLVLSWAFGFYVAQLGRYALFYGSLAAVAILLVWFWLSSLALLLGAELNAQLEGIRDLGRSAAPALAAGDAAALALPPPPRAPTLELPAGPLRGAPEREAAPKSEREAAPKSGGEREAAPKSARVT
jgi:membrane protein